MISRARRSTILLCYLALAACAQDELHLREQQDAVREAGIRWAISEVPSSSKSFCIELEDRDPSDAFLISIPGAELFAASDCGALTSDRTGALATNPITGAPVPLITANLISGGSAREPLVGIGYWVDAGDGSLGGSFWSCRAFQMGSGGWSIAECERGGDF